MTKESANQETFTKGEWKDLDCIIHLPLYHLSFEWPLAGTGCRVGGKMNKNFPIHKILPFLFAMAYLNLIPAIS